MQQDFETFYSTTSDRTPAYHDDPSTSAPSSVSRIVESAKPLSERILDRLGLFKKITDEDYLNMMKAKRDNVLVQVRALEAQIAEERAQKAEEMKREMTVPKS
jgi:hypothetical protein